MAKHCGLHRDTVWAAIGFLLERKLIIRQSRRGQTTIYHPSEIEGWVNAPGPYIPVTPPESKGHHPPEKEGHKGYPTKGILKRVSPPFSKNGDYDPNSQEEYLKMKRELGMD